MTESGQHDAQGGDDSDSGDDEAEFDAADPGWKRLYDALVITCKWFGDENAFGRADFWVVDDDWGDHNQKICVTSLSFLTPKVVLAIQQCIRDAGFPGAQVMVQLELQRYAGDTIPPEGLIVKADSVTEYWDLPSIRATVGNDFYRSRPSG